MNGLFHHLGIVLRLHFRNRMALFYGYLFPLIFLLAFWVLYRYENVPLVRHLGELLTVSVLGGACFGLPTTLVSERERGVWRRYRLSPLSIGSLVGSTLAARYLLILSAGLLQVAVAMAFGMPLPKHPFDLWVAFTVVAFAFLGLGLVIASLANNVPAVQALGQCIFLPMLIIGGVAVPLSTLPAWAQHVSAFFPGRYAVEAMQACTNGGGLGAVSPALLSLLVIGLAGGIAGAQMFRWDAQQRFGAQVSKGWVALALAGWLAVGSWAEVRGRILVAADTPESTPAPAAAPSETPPAPSPAPSPEPAVAPEPAVPAAPPPPAEPAPAPAAEPPAEPAEPRSWREITPANLQAIRSFRIPPDHGVVAPIAPAEEEPYDEFAALLESIREKLPDWGPAQVSDPVQRIRNYLYVAAMPDAIQLPIESFVPAIVFEAMNDTMPADQLTKVLAWIVLHPFDGDASALARLPELGIENAAYEDLVRERVYYYAIKAILRLTEK